MFITRGILANHTNPPSENIKMKCALFALIKVIQYVKNTSSLSIGSHLLQV
jgi:hypothetical protein